MIKPVARTDQVASTPVRWRRLSLAETVASDRASAACYRRTEDIDFLPVVMPELKFGDVQRQTFAADSFNRVG